MFPRPRSLDPVKTFIAQPPRRWVKDGIMLRKAQKREAMRESHHNMSEDGIERRVNGNRLGHRRRIQILNELLASF